MLASPWSRLAAPEPDREYLVLLTYLPLRRYRAIPRFLDYSRRIVGQLAGAAGLIGYSFKGNLLRRDFWTLSAWEGEAALRAFSYQGVHRNVMIALRGDMGPTRFVRWSVRGSELPPRWKDALGRVAAAQSGASESSAGGGSRPPEELSASDEQSVSGRPSAAEEDRL